MLSLDTFKRAAKESLRKWNDATPGEKARFATVTTVCTIINPLIPIVYAGVYGAAAVHDATKDK